MFLYLGAASLLSLSIFGLLSYVEPVLLLVAAVAMGEQLFLRDAFTYAPIVLALSVLALDGFRSSVRCADDGSRSVGWIADTMWKQVPAREIPEK